MTVAKNLPQNQSLPFCSLIVKTEGVEIETISSETTTVRWPIDCISYGVQDLVYTRVFAMIVVQDKPQQNESQFNVHAFVCDSRLMARQLTYALAASFQQYSRNVKEAEELNLKSQNNRSIEFPLKGKFAIDLRTPEELQQEHETEA